MDNIFEKLLSLPLFQGVSRESLTKIAEKTPFHFLKYTDGEAIVRTGDVCSHLKFLLSGNVCIEAVSQNKKIRIQEQLAGPDMLTPMYLFGKETHYQINMQAVGDAGLMQIDKSSFINILRKEPICLINYLNTLSLYAQACPESQLYYSAAEIRERFAYWVLSLTQQKAFNIRILSKQKDLYTFFGVQRSAFLNILEEMQNAGIIKCTPYEVTVLDRSMLKEIVRNTL